jgi:hypothetical protein
MNVQNAVANPADSRFELAESDLLQHILAYQNLELLERVKRKLDLSQEEAAELFDDTKRYLYLCSVSKESLAPTWIIDECWHEFILYTREYAGFCQRWFGRFIHHAPSETLSYYVVHNPVATVALAHETFGDLSTNWTADGPEVRSKECAGCGGSH